MENHTESRISAGLSFLASDDPAESGGHMCCLDGPWELRLEGKPYQPWRSIPIPSNWNRAGLENHSGVVFFRRRFCLTGSIPHGPIFLRFRGVDYFARVWLNGTFLGNHEGYFQPFEFEVSEYMDSGLNELLVRVDAPHEAPGPAGWPTAKRLIKGVLNHHDCRPGGSSPTRGQEIGTGGIWNTVELIAPGVARIESVRATAQLQEDDAHVTVQVTLSYFGKHPTTGFLALDVEPENFVATAQVQSVGVELDLHPGQTTAQLQIELACVRRWNTWDQGEPNLYRFRVTLSASGRGLATYSEPIGLRTIRMDCKKTFFLNERRLFLRGTNLIPTQWLAEYGELEIARDIELMKQANINAVRIHGHVQRDEFYRACDRAGIFVWADFALQWGYARDDAFIANAVSQIRDWSWQLHNRCSIGVWCCHNEPVGDQRGLDRRLADTVQQENPDRIVFETSDFSQHAYPGWYAGRVGDFAALPSAPLVTEYGAQALPGLEGMAEILGSDHPVLPQTLADWDEWAYHDFQRDQTFHVARIDAGSDLASFIEASQRYQAHLLAFATETYRVNKNNGVSGIFQFMFVDCWPSITWSVLDHDRRPKRGYRALMTALQPILVTFHGGWLRRERLEIGSQWSLATLFNVTVVNDLHQSFDHAWLSVSAQRGGKDLLELYRVSIKIAADSVQVPLPVARILQGTFPYPDLPEQVLLRVDELGPGTYRLVARVHDSEGLKLSENTQEIEWLAPVEGTSSSG